MNLAIIYYIIPLLILGACLGMLASKRSFIQLLAILEMFFLGLSYGFIFMAFDRQDAKALFFAFIILIMVGIGTAIGLGIYTLFFVKSSTMTNDTATKISSSTEDTHQKKSDIMSMINLKG